MSYLVLARKYRPQIFDHVIKQDHVTKTLAHAISSDRIAHALLFSGPRGTGKTTVARILAKAMNCKNGPAPVPCNECRSCREITSGNATDVFEIDGASNNSVEQVRELRNNSKYMPAHSRYKIYIIDEVHMLSTAAFNALLKTLEEPPSHVLFFFATTEPHKIPTTILSRCQQHDLRRIDLDAISKHMKSICKKENINIADESLELIAREACGCMRDALSLLDQVISCTEGEITHDNILDILGVIDRKIIFDISQSIVNNKTTDFLTIVDDIYNRGHDIKRLYSELIEHFRNLLVVKMGKKINKLVDVPSHEIKLMKTQIKSVSETYLNQILGMLFSEEAAIKLSAHPRLALEMTFIKMFQIKPALSIDTLIKKIDTLRKEVAENQPDPTISNSRQSVLQREDQVPAQTVKESTAAFVSTKKQAPIKQDVSNTDAAASEHLPEDKEKTWEKFLDFIAQQYPSLSALLTDSALLRLTDQRIQIEVSSSKFNINRLKRNKNMSILKKTCNEFFKKEMDLDIKAKINSNCLPQDRNHTGRLKQEAINHPLVTEAIEVFNGNIVDVKIL